MKGKWLEVLHLDLDLQFIVETDYNEIEMIIYFKELQSP